MRRLLVFALFAAMLIGPLANAVNGARVLRIGCRDGARCDIDGACDGSCFMLVCGNVRHGLRHCRPNPRKTRYHRWQVSAGEADGACDNGVCMRIRCRPAAQTCVSRGLPCTLTLGAPFDRKFDCRALFNDWPDFENPDGATLALTLRDGARSAVGWIGLRRAASGHYTASNPAFANIDIPPIAGVDLPPHIRILPEVAGGEIVADVTVGSKLSYYLFEAAGSVHGAFVYGTPPTLVPFAVDF